MNYKWHTGISLSVVTCVAVYLAYLQTHVLYEVGLFWALGYFHTVYASPDIDHEKSRPTQNLGVIGKVTSKTFTHRKTLHNPYFWTILYAALGYYIS